MKRVLIGPNEIPTFYEEKLTATSPFGRLCDLFDASCVYSGFVFRIIFWSQLLIGENEPTRVSKNGTNRQIPYLWEK